MKVNRITDPDYLASDDAIIPQKYWRLAATIFILTLLFLGILAALLTLGLADPPRAGHLIAEAYAPASWALLRQHGEMILHTGLPARPEGTFTLELTTANHGTQESAWGIWLETATGQLHFLVDNQGYFSVTEEAQPRWQPFMHLRSGAENKLYLHYPQPEAAVLRLNDEIAWAGALTLPPESQWGFILYRRPRLHAYRLALYAPRKQHTYPPGLCLFSPL